VKLNGITELTPKAVLYFAMMSFPTPVASQSSCLGFKVHLG